MLKNTQIKKILSSIALFGLLFSNFSFLLVQQTHAGSEDIAMTLDGATCNGSGIGMNLNDLEFTNTTATSTYSVIDSTTVSFSTASTGWGNGSFYSQPLTKPISMEFSTKDWGYLMIGLIPEGKNKVTNNWTDQGNKLYFTPGNNLYGYAASTTNGNPVAWGPSSLQGSFTIGEVWKITVDNDNLMSFYKDDVLMHSVTHDATDEFSIVVNSHENTDIIEDFVVTHAGSASGLIITGSIDDTLGDNAPYELFDITNNTVIGEVTIDENGNYIGGYTVPMNLDKSYADIQLRSVGDSSHTSNTFNIQLNDCIEPLVLGIESTSCVAGERDLYNFDFNENSSINSWTTDDGKNFIVTTNSGWDTSYSENLTRPLHVEFTTDGVGSYMIGLLPEGKNQTTTNWNDQSNKIFHSNATTYGYAATTSNGNPVAWTPTTLGVGSPAGTKWEYDVDENNLLTIKKNGVILHSVMHNATDNFKLALSVAASTVNIDNLVISDGNSIGGMQINGSITDPNGDNAPYELYDQTNDVIIGEVIPNDDGLFNKKYVIDTSLDNSSANLIVRSSANPSVFFSNTTATTLSHCQVPLLSNGIISVCEAKPAIADFTDYVWKNKVGTAEADTVSESPTTINASDSSLTDPAFLDIELELPIELEWTRTNEHGYIGFTPISNISLDNGYAYASSFSIQQNQNYGGYTRGYFGAGGWYGTYSSTYKIVIDENGFGSFYTDGTLRKSGQGPVENYKLKIGSNYTVTAMLSSPSFPGGYDTKIKPSFIDSNQSVVTTPYELVHLDGGTETVISEFINLPASLITTLVGTSNYYIRSKNYPDIVKTPTSSVTTLDCPNIGDLSPIVNSNQILTVAETTADGGNVGSVTATEPDGDALLDWSIDSGNDSGVFSINIQTGEIVVNDSSYLNALSQGQYILGVSVSDGIHRSDSKNITINVVEGNKIPTGITASQTTLDENMGVNGVIADLSSIDGDASDSHIYSLVSGNGDDDNALFSITGNQIQTNSNLDFENPQDSGDVANNNTYSIRVQTDDQNGGVYSKKLIFTIEDINEAPTSLSIDSQQITENNTAGALVGNFSVTDPDNGDTLIYSFCSAADNSFFQLNGTSLQASESLDYESQETYNICIRSTDVAGLFFDQNLTITALDTDEIKPIISLSGPATKIKNTPITDITVNISDNESITSSNVELISTSMASNIVCSQITTTSVTCSVSIDSSGDLVIKATDTAGNEELLTDSNYIIDATDPSVPDVIVTLDQASLHTPTVAFSSIDNHGISRYDISYFSDDGNSGTLGSAVTQTGVTSPMNLQLDPDETIHSVTVTVYDFAGNSSSSTSKFPPIITFTTTDQIGQSPLIGSFTVENPDGNDVTNISLIAGNTNATLGTCTGSDGGTTDPYANITTCTINNITGSGTIIITAENAFNGAEGKNQQSFIIDDILPEILLTASTKTSSGTISDTTFIISDNYGIEVSGISIGTNDTTGATNLACTQTTGSRLDCTIDIIQSGNLEITAVDSSGNTFSLLESDYIVDTISPSVVIARASTQNAQTETLPLEFDITFSEEIDPTSFTAGDISLSGVSGSVVNGPILSSGNIWKIYIGDITDNGTITVDINANSITDLVGNSNTQSTGIDNSVDFIDNYTPTDISLDETTLEETNEIGKVVGNVTTTDQDSTDTHSYSIACSSAGTDDSYFSINNESLTLAQALDYETKSSYSVCIKTQDQKGATFEKTFTITVTDLDEIKPVITLIGNTVIQVPAFGTYTEPGATWTDNVDGSGNVASIEGSVNTSIPGTYTLTYNAVDLSGNEAISLTRQIQVIDTEAPVITLSGSGTIQIGEGETYTDAGATALDNVDGTDFVAASGSVDTSTIGFYTLTYDHSDIAGNAATQVTRTVEVTDVTPPIVPVITTPTNGSPLTGTGEPGSTIEITDENGNVIGTGTVDSNGNYEVTLDPIPTSGDITVATTDASGNTSTAVIDAGTAIDTTGPTTPVITTPTNGSPLTGTGEPGSTIEITDENGNVIGTGTVDSNGNYEVTLDPIPSSGDITVATTDPAGNTSTAVIDAGTAIDTTGPTAPVITTPTNGSPLTGTGEPGSTIEITDENGNVIGTGAVDPNGNYEVTLDPIPSSGDITVATTDAAGNTSTAVIDAGTAIDTTDPTTPVITTPTNGSPLTGTGEPGSVIEITDENGNVIGTGTVDANGDYEIVLDPIPTSGDITVETTDAAGNTSTAVIDAGTAIDTTGPTAPVITTPTNGSPLTGTGEPGSVIEITDENGNVIGTGTVDPNGNYEVTLDPIPSSGDITVATTDAAGNTSTAVIDAGTAIDTTGPTTPVITTPTNGSPLTGTGEPGSVIEITDENGNVIGSGTVDSNGNYEVTLDPIPSSGDITVATTDAAGNSSTAVIDAGTAIDTTDPTTPVITTPTNGSPLTGTGEPGSTIEITDENGNVIGTGTVDSNGNYEVTLDPIPSSGDITVATTDAAGNTSTAVIDAGTAIDTTGPTTPVITTPTNGSPLTGTGEPGSTIEITDENGNVIGSGTVDPNGNYEVTLDPIPSSGDITVATTDAAGNTSTAVIDAGTAIDTTGPTAPVITTPTNGSPLTGTGEPGSVIEITDENGNVIGTGTVDTNGNYEVTLDPIPSSGDITVATTDASGNTSTAVIDAGTAIDTTGPTAPVITTPTNGSPLTGTGEPGSVIEITDENGNVIGSGTVDPNGNYEVTLDPIPSSGDITIATTDAAGNTSTAVIDAGTAIDTTGPTTPVITTPTNGSPLTGTGEPGSTIEITDENGNVIGSGTVDPNGNYEVTLDPIPSSGDITVATTDAAGNTSTAVIDAGTAIDTTGPTAPVITTPTNGSPLTGTGEPGSVIEITDENGNVIGTGTVDTNGNYEVTLDPIPSSGDITVATTDASGNTSTAVIDAGTAIDTTGPTAPVITTPTNGSPLTGTGEPGSVIEITDENGTVIGTGTVDTNGNYEVTLDPIPSSGDITVATTDAAGNTSTAVIDAGTAIDTTAPTDPVITTPTNGSPLAGTGEPGSVIEITDENGNVIGTGTVDANGDYEIVLSPVPTSGDITVETTDAAGNTSSAVIDAGTAIDTTGPTAPSVTGGITNGNPVLGKSEAGMIVTIATPSGSFCTTTSDSSGNYSCILTPTPEEGDSVIITATDNVGNSNSTTISNGIDLTKPEIIEGSTQGIYTDTSATISWETSEPSSSEIVYGLTTTINESTGERDIQPPVREHAVTLSNLSACTKYFYKTISKDTAGNKTTEGIFDFSTTGCAADTGIISTNTYDFIPTTIGATGIGGNDTLSSGTNNELEVTIPVGYFDTGIGSCAGSGTYFQFKELTMNPIISLVGKPNEQNISLKTYDLSAYCNVDEKVHEFDKNISVQLSYLDNEIVSINESSIRIYRYDEDLLKWVILDNCSVQDQENTVSCDTNHFSTFGIFGDPITNNTPSTNGASSGGGGGSTIICEEEKHLECRKYTEGQYKYYKKTGKRCTKGLLGKICSPSVNIGEEETSVEDKTTPTEDSSKTVNTINSLFEPTFRLSEILNSVEFIQYNPETFYELESVKELDDNSDEKDYTISNNFGQCSIIQSFGSNDFSNNSMVFLDNESISNTELTNTFTSLGIIEGTKEGYFEPQKMVTRSEFLKIILRTHCYDYTDEIVNDSGYIDVTHTSWQAKVIQKSEALGMITGDTNKKGEKIFRPNDPISKIEALKILLNISNIHSKHTENLQYIDILTEWQKEYVINAQLLGLVDPIKDNHIFSPDTGVRREDMLEMIDTLVKLY